MVLSKLRKREEKKKREEEDDRVKIRGFSPQEVTLPAKTVRIRYLGVMHSCSPRSDR